MSDFAVGGVDGDGHLLSVLLVSDHLFDVDAPSASVNSKDFTSLASDAVVHASPLDEHGVALPDGDGPAVVLVSQLLAQVAAHHLSLDAGGGGEVSLS